MVLGCHSTTYVVDKIQRALYYELYNGELEDIINQRTFDWVRAIQVTEMLRFALLEAEELYISAEEDPSPKLIVLDPQSREKKAGP